MENLNCAVVRDLLPLCAEGLVSPETGALVDAHLDGCPECRARLEQMTRAIPGPEEYLQEATPLKRVYWQLLLLLLTAPVWLPLLLSFAAVALVLYLCLWVVLFALWFVPLSLACGAAAVPPGWLLGLWPLGGVYALGSFLLCAGLAVLCGYGCWQLTRLLLRLTRWLGRRVKRLFTGNKEGKNREAA